MADQNSGNWLFGFANKAPSAALIIRLMTGSVFLWEGILKFVYPSLGVGRFTKLGIPFPDTTAVLIGILEIVGGLGLITGFLTRIFSALFVIEMVVAILSTKIPMALGRYPLALAPSPPQAGLGLILHEVRSEYAQLMTSLFLFVVGPGRLSFDAMIAGRSRKIADFSLPQKIREKEGVYQK